MSEADLSAGIPEVVATRRTHDRWLAVRVDTLRYPSGREGEFDVVEHAGGITVLAIDQNDQLLFVRQYRHPIGRELIELPAGTLEPGESHETAAKRELQEETGYRPGRLKRLGGVYTAPGYSTEYLPVFLATDLVESPLEGDEEAIALERMPLDEALRRIAAGEIEDAKTMGALLLYLHSKGSLPSS